MMFAHHETHPGFFTRSTSVFMFAIVAATIYHFKDALKTFLTLHVGRCFMRPVGVVTLMFANGRGKVVRA